MGGVAGSYARLSNIAGVMSMFAVCACTPMKSDSSASDGPDNISEVEQSLVNGCGGGVCLSYTSCTSWDLNVLNDGYGYTLAPEFVEYAPDYTYRCEAGAVCDFDAMNSCPFYAATRRNELIAMRPGISQSALDWFAVTFSQYSIGYFEEGCGPFDQYCVMNEIYSCELHIENYPSPMTGVRSACPCAQPVPPVVCGANNAVAGGIAHTCALVAGGVQCWGSNSHGQLGDGSAVTRNYNRVAVTGLTSGVYTISSGGTHTCAIVAGEVKCWGFNSHGQLGNPVPGESHVPVTVAGLSGVQAIAGGDLHSCAIAGNAAWCWGYNGTGQLGASSATTESKVPIQVSGLASGVQFLAAGASHSCAVVNGAAKCWGDNTSGQLGNGTLNGPPPPPQSFMPVAVTGLTTGVQTVVAGLAHSCALVNGGVKCWGNNSHGQLGNGTPGGQPPTSLSYVPVNVTGLSSGVLSLIAGRDHTCALLTGGAMKCWGNNTSGQLGMGSLEPSASSFPVAVTGLASGVQAVATGYQHTCALGASGIQCWGNNGGGQLAVDTDNMGLSTLPLAIGQFTCVLVNGSMQCTST